jgi:hypothetical protein
LNPLEYGIQNTGRKGGLNRNEGLEGNKTNIFSLPIMY